MPVSLLDLSPQSAPSPDSYDGFLLVSFGGPEGPDDVIPFLENVLRGKNVPRERMLEVAEHYQHFGGKSPINDQNRALMSALFQEFRESGVDLPIYWGNRNWHPSIEDALRTMRDDGLKNVIVFFTSMFSSYSGCRQYRENVAAAQQAIGPTAPTAVRLRLGFNHPGFIETMVSRVADAIGQFPANQSLPTRLLFTAHSIPMSMAEKCSYVKQLQEASRLVADQVPCDAWELCFQSRSGPPQVPWLVPDICDHIESLNARYQEGSIPSERLVIVPIGFVSDHMEVIYDLDEEAAELCDRLMIPMQRAASAGTHPRFVRMIRELVQERLAGGHVDRPVAGNLPPCADICAPDCCTYEPRRPPSR